MRPTTAIANEAEQRGWPLTFCRLYRDAFGNADAQTRALPPKVISAQDAHRHPPLDRAVSAISWIGRRARVSKRPAMRGHIACVRRR
jgi:hypothetical protein